ncbi:MAG: FAD:protein transferase [Actinomycetia bacterium]|nr:FAD:protein transferase [Actinomycetes bacterium]
MTGGEFTFSALGTTAILLVTERDALASAREALEAEIAAIDRACSRFRDDSDLMRVNANAGDAVAVSSCCIEALHVALRAARVTDGIVDPTIGRAVRVLGYDRDFDIVERNGPPLRVRAERVPGWHTIEIDDVTRTVRVPQGVELDVGATAKALCADRAAAAAYDATGAGVVVGLGGDIAITGPAPESGWPIRVTDDHTAHEGGQTIALRAGGLATSGTTRRTWVRGEVRLHHLIDPRTGAPAESPWRTVSVAAASCVDANIASTAAIVLGNDALAWLEERQLPARLVAYDGAVTVAGGWPADDSVDSMDAAVR